MMHKNVLLLFIFSIMSCRMASQQHSDHPHTNQLIHENSPYLLQHAHNPVDWYPWGEAALSKAQKEQKMLLISIGYAACHWCHVMEHESFEDSVVAKVMNDNFVCIKIDREERPDIDDVYMTACQLASGRGCGWPLNAFALPDGRPVWAGTYFPKEQWMNVLAQFSNMWQNEKEKLDDYAKQLTQGIQSQDQIILGPPRKLNLADAHKMAEALITKIDTKRGGRQGAPKFPMPSNYRYLLSYHQMTGNKEALKSVLTTLDHMARGGIYDQLGGGFSRYSVDADWIVPHFEKMMYDNGQLVSLYSQAYQVIGDERYREIVDQTIGWLDREMTNELGGFYASLDADSEGEEGKFYVWYEHEIDSLLPEDEREVYKDYYTIRPQGNWEDEKNILYRKKPISDILKKHNLAEESLAELIERSNKILFDHRVTRVRPGLDDKVLTSWNALMLIGLVDAYRAFQDRSYLDRALRNAAFIKSNMLQPDFRLMRNYKDGKVKINAFLDDYAFLIEGLLALYQVTFDESWLNDAKALTEYAIEHFYDSEQKLFNYTSDIDPPLVARKKQIGDDVIPGSNSAMARNLNFLSHYFYDQRYREISDQLLFSLIDPIIESGQTSFYSNWALLYLEKLHPTYEIAIVGDKYEASKNEMQKRYLPNALYMGGKDEGTLALLKDKLQPSTTMIYVCQNKVCQLPVEDPNQALDQIEYLIE